MRLKNRSASSVQIKMILFAALLSQFIIFPCLAQEPPGELFKIEESAGGVQNSNAARTALRRGHQSMEQKSYRDALDAYQEAIKADPKFGDAYVAKAEASIKLGSVTFDDKDQDQLYADAILDCNKAIAISARNAKAYFHRGVAQRMLERLTMARDSFTAAILIHPKDGLTYLRRGIVSFYLSEDMTQALADFNETIRINSNDYRAYLWQGLAFARQTKYAQAIKAYTAAMDRNSDYVLAYHNRGLAHLQLRQYEKAVRDFDEAIRIAPNDAKAYFRRAIAQGKLEKNDAAIQSYKKAIYHQRDYAEAFYNRSIIYVLMNEPEKSQADFSAAARLKPELRKRY